MPRVLTPEILDGLPSDDPDAMRSRRDLRRINIVMGNYRWIARHMADHDHSVSHWIELGAGDGELADHINFRKPVTGLDFMGRPENWPEQWNWQSGDLFETLPEILGQSDSVGIVANLFLHHFSDEQLGQIGKLFEKNVKVLIFSEPARHWLHLAQCFLANPLFNDVTKHDARVSVEAGFRSDELARALKIEANGFQMIETSHSLIGAQRTIGIRRDAE